MWAQFDRPKWALESPSWPNSDVSSFVETPSIRWHIQRMGPRGNPVIVLVHGTWSSTHSYRDIMPLLADDYDIVAVDLPGHGFTETSWTMRPTLPRVAAALAELLETLEVTPIAGVGHSAGAAVLVRMALDGQPPGDRKRRRPARDGMPGGIISLNGAMLPFRGIAGQVFPSMAKMLVMNPLVPQMVAATGYDSARVKRLIASTGSVLDEEGQQLYQRLMRCSGHVAGALAMMAHWDLDPLVRDLGKLRVPLTLITGDADMTVSPAEAREVAARVRHARRVNIRGLGHLAHEEDPAQIAALIRRHLAASEDANCEKPRMLQTSELP